MCGDPIRWGILPGNRWIAMDPDPTPGGCYVMLRDDRRVIQLPDALTLERLRDPAVQARRHADHHRTCALRGMLKVSSAPRRKYRPSTNGSH